jgi:predicted DCC family thiol-disulfide oxidoreductase YuxK
MGAHQITVIYDGQCQLCQNSISWVSKKLAITALDFHTTDLTQFQLSTEQCSREVFVITAGKRYSGARAVAVLLKVRGNRALSALITLSGPVGRTGYRWVAGNRNSWPVKVLSRILEN